MKLRYKIIPVNDMECKGGCISIFAFPAKCHNFTDEEHALDTG